MNDMDKTLDDANIQMDQDVGLFIFQHLTMLPRTDCDLNSAFSIFAFMEPIRIAPVRLRIYFESCV